MAAKVRRYRRKPAEIDAVLHEGDPQATVDQIRAAGWLHLAGFVTHRSESHAVDGSISVEGINGVEAFVKPGEYLVLVNGCFKAFGADHFAAVYEPAEQEGALV